MAMRWMTGGRDKLRCVRGQMAVELCIVFPVAIIIAVIAVNALTFFSECAEFDRVGRNAVRQVAAVPAHGQTLEQSAAEVRAVVEGALDAENLTCEVTAVPAGDDLCTYSLELRYAPTLFGMGLVDEVFGVDLPALTHTSELTVSVYTPGKLLL